MAKKRNKNFKIGLAFSGGSALGMAHIGVIRALKENNISIDCVAGTSAGAMAAVALAFGISEERMIELSKKMNWTSISKFGYSKMGFNSNEPLGKTIEEMVGDARIEDAKIPLAIVATNIDTGEEVIFREGSVARAVMASACLPGLYVPVEIKGKKMVDGGLVENLPISPLRKMGADVKIGVNLERWRKYKKTKNVVDVFRNAFRTLIQPQIIMVPDESEVLIEPHLEKFTSSDFGKIEELVEKGYEAAMQKIPEIKMLINRERIIHKPKKFLQKIGDFFAKYF